MMKKYIYTAIISIILASCGGKKNKQQDKSSIPVITENGKTIFFPDTLVMAFFKTETVNISSINAELTAPAKVAATIVASAEGASRNIILFESPDLSVNYTQLIQHQMNIVLKRNIIEQKKAIIGQKNAIIKQKQTELERFKDLALHGAGTGKDVADAQTDLLSAQSDLTAAETDLRIAQTDLANEQSSIIEHEAALKSGGFNPKTLLQSPAGIAYIICDIPENQIEKIKEGKNCSIQFTAFPGEQFTATIDDVADVVDNVTRMAKVRIAINNSGNKLKSGMYAIVSFGVNEGRFISISKNSLVTVQGKNFAFVKKSPLVFERREIKTAQQIGDRVIILSGLNNGDAVVLEGVVQLKGLSFGY